MKKVSVIIPVYNGEKYLRQCLDSVCGQTLEEIEIICVDDGSTDSTIQILEEYQKKDARIQVFSQENKFAGAARNLGKMHATGEYLIFWDSDDFFALDALEKLYAQAVKVQADICVCGGNKYFNDTKKIVPNISNYLITKYIPEEVFNTQTNEDYILNFTTAVPWNKLFRREFIEKINLDFQAIRNGNDIYFTQCAMVLAERVTTVNEGLIYYRVNNEESLTGTLSKSPLVPISAWISVVEKLTDLKCFPKRSYENKVMGALTALFRNINQPDAFSETFDFLKNGGLKKLHIEQHEEEFYYAKWHYEFITHLVNDTIKDFQAYLLYKTYNQLIEKSAEKMDQNAKIKEKNIKIKDIEKKIEENNKKNKELCGQIRQIKSLNKEIKQQKEQLEQQLKEQQAEVKQLQKKLKKTETERDKIRNSWSYKVGRIIMWLPGKIKKLCFR